MKVKKEFAAAIMAVSMLLTGCGTASTDETSAVASAERGEAPTVDSDGYAGVSGDGEAESSEAATGNDYDYPESIMSENAPYGREISLSGVYVAVPGIFDDTMPRAGYADYLMFERDGNGYYMYTTGCSWSAYSEAVEYNLEEAPDALYNSFIELLRDGPFDVNHQTPFTHTDSTQVTLESDEYLEIDGREFRRQSGTVHGNNYGLEGDAYFTVYYVLSDSAFTNADGIEVSEPSMAMFFTGDLSEQGRQLIDDCADYAVTHAYLVEE